MVTVTSARRRNKNFGKTKIEYDVNVYVLEEYNAETMESYWDETKWYLHVYDYNNGDSVEVSTPFLLTKEESFAMNFNGCGDIDDGLDGWLTMDLLLEDYKDLMSDRIRQYLESFPKYHEDVKLKTIYN